MNMVSHKKNIGVAELRNVPGYGKIENGELNKH
jgi:hypothetical protein